MGGPRLPASWAAQHSRARTSAPASSTSEQLPSGGGRRALPASASEGRVRGVTRGEPGIPDPAARPHSAGDAGRQWSPKAGPPGPAAHFQASGRRKGGAWTHPPRPRHLGVGRGRGTLVWAEAEPLPSWRCRHGARSLSQPGCTDCSGRWPDVTFHDNLTGLPAPLGSRLPRSATCPGPGRGPDPQTHPVAPSAGAGGSPGAPPGVRAHQAPEPARYSASASEA